LQQVGLTGSTLTAVGEGCPEVDAHVWQCVKLDWRAEIGLIQSPE
jgi:hypothetical protein